MHLSYGEPQTALAITFAVLALLFAGLFVTIGVQSHKQLPYATVRRWGYRLRSFWLWSLILIFTALMATSLFFLPYSGARAHSVTVDVTGAQFSWSITPSHVPVDTTVRFDVTSVDVNHGFGIYSPGGVMIGSVQAMPGYHNVLYLTLHQRGTYFIACLEYCGIGHTRMTGTFKVS